MPTAINRYSADLPSLGDLNINLDKADQEASSPGQSNTSPQGGDELPDIPVAGNGGGNNQLPDVPAESTEEKPAAEPDTGLDFDFGGGSGSSSDSKSDTSSNKTEQIKEIKDQIDKATLETEIAALKAQITRLLNENELTHSRMRELKETFDEYVLFRIPKYQEIDLPASKFDPQYLLPHIANALDKRFIKVFKDVPTYDFRSFEVMDRDEDENIANALIRVGIKFHPSSPYSFLKFDLELWIVGGILEVPGWFVYNKSIYTFDEEGIRTISDVSTRMHQLESAPVTNQKSWYNINHNQNNPIAPHQVDIPPSSLQMQNVWRNKKSL